MDNLPYFLAEEERTAKQVSSLWDIYIQRKSLEKPTAIKGGGRTKY
jgi:hypothetical protein